MKKILLYFLPIILFACNPSKKDLRSDIATGNAIRYATGFEIETHTNYQILRIKNPWHNGNVLQSYVLIPKNEKLPENPPEGIIIRTPLQRTVAFSSVVCGMMNELNVLSSLVGVAEPQYITIPQIRRDAINRTLADVGQASRPNIELLMSLEAEALFTNPVNESGAASLEKLSATTIPCLEWMENHPLGQAEWIRVFGLLFDKKALADSLFAATEQSYQALQSLCDTVSHRPTVMIEKKYGDFWYMPGGQSYFAHLLNAAGADYLFKDNSSSGSIPYKFENVLDRAEKAYFWLFKYYDANDLTYKQLAAEFPGYEWFDAYKNRKIYACNTQKTAHYYHELPLHPDWILEDLIRIFHPGLLSGGSLRYYFPLKESD
ncbi:MAG: ABC transporter substrate-binding protein [Dysgonamonadaceae bacterium]|jgi:iron complex transport system substrate-binding protein|nr:ABC transporter substrate-binding protein [Dysgonamonadaceae bacterium]